MKADVFWQRPTASNPFPGLRKGHQLRPRSNRSKTVLQYFETNTVAPTRLAAPLAPTPPPAEDRVRNPGNGERAERALAAAAHPGGVTFPSPNSSAAWGLADSSSMLSSDRGVS